MASWIDISVFMLPYLRKNFFKRVMFILIIRIWRAVTLGNSLLVWCILLVRSVLYADTISHQRMNGFSVCFHIVLYILFPLPFFCLPLLAFFWFFFFFQKAFAFFRYFSALKQNHINDKDFLLPRCSYFSFTRWFALETSEKLLNL